MVDWNKGLRQKRAVVNQNLALRNENLAQQTGMSLPQNRAARAAADYAAPAPSIIGGQLVQPGDTAGYNAANTQRNAVAADANARMDLQSSFGSRSLTSNGMRENMGRARDSNLSATSSLSPTKTRRTSFGDEFGDGMMDGGVVGKPKMVKQPGYAGGGKVKMPDKLGYEMGGQIGPEVTKWAGEKKKKGMRGYAMGGKIGNKTEDDGKDTVDVRVREGEYMLNPETVGFMGGGSYQDGVRMLDDVVRQATGQEPGPVPVNDEGEVMRGFRNGGKMGYAQSGATLRPGAQAVAEEARRLAQAEAREMERIRQARMGSSRPNANAGPQQPMRSGAAPARPTTASFGPAPQTVVNDLSNNAARSSGPARTGFRGALNTGGSGATVSQAARGVANTAGNVARTGTGFIKSAPIISALVAGGEGAYRGARTDTNDYRLRMGFDPVDRTDGYSAGERIADLGVRTAGVVSDVGASAMNALALPYNLTTSETPVNFRDNFADVRSATAGANEQATIDARLAAQDSIMERMGVTREQAAAGDVPEGFDEAMQFAMANIDRNNVLPGALDQLNALGDAQVDLTSGSQTAEEQAAALDAERAAAGEFYRPFGGGEVSLRGMPEAAASQAVAPGGMNIVQRTGGPNNEVIVREDVDGVPTFSNLRTAQQGGDAATLQAQADARVREDMGIRARQNAVVQQMRDSAPQYGADEVAAGQDRQSAERIAAIKNADKNSVASLEDMRGELASLGLFTNPDTGEVDDRMYFDFIDRVGAELASQGMDITQMPADMKMQLAQEYDMALPASQRFNNIVQGETGMNPNAILSPEDVGRSREPTLRDLGWFNDQSDVGATDILFNRPVNDVAIPGADGNMTLTRDDLLGRDLRTINFFEGRGGR